MVTEKEAHDAISKILEYIEPGQSTREGLKDTPLRVCLLYTSPSPRDVEESRMPSSA